MVVGNHFCIDRGRVSLGGVCYLAPHLHQVCLVIVGEALDRRCHIRRFVCAGDGACQQLHMVIVRVAVHIVTAAVCCVRVVYQHVVNRYLHRVFRRRQLVVHLHHIQYRIRCQEACVEVKHLPYLHCVGVVHIGCQALVVFDRLITNSVPVLAVFHKRHRTVEIRQVVALSREGRTQQRHRYQRAVCCLALHNESTVA